MRKFIKLLMGQRLRNRHQLYAVFILALFSLTSIYFILKYNVPQRKHVKRHKYKAREQVPNKLVANTIVDKEIECKIPELDPFSDEVMKFDEGKPKIECEGMDWVECEACHCTVKPEILKNMDNVLCIYKDIIYKNDHNTETSRQFRIPNDEPYTLNQSDFVKVSCVGNEKSLSTTSTSTSRWHGYKAGLRPINIPDSYPSHDTIHVMILCFDSTSRNGFIRKMPHSYQFLTKDLGATILSGYNVVGDGSSAAIIPILSGRTESELPDTKKKTNKDKYINPEDFIFKQVRRYGYRTAFYEDMPWIGMFKYTYNGFKSQPADHYTRPFFLEESKSGKKWWNGRNRKHCLGSIPQHNLMLNLTKQFVGVEQKHFSFTFIADISHEDFNWISNADDDLVALLKHMKETSKMRNHLVIIMGDHGARYHSKIRETYQGRIEERLPLMAIILPDILKNNYPEGLINLNNNQKILTTPFDIHTTILHAMGLDEHMNHYSIPGSNILRGLSLLNPIPKSRTCGQAGVLSHWCVCATWHNVANDEAIYTKVVHALVKFINELTSEVRSKCMERQLVATEWVMWQSTKDDLIRFHHGRDSDIIHRKYVPGSVKAQPSSTIYQAKIVMNPGRAVYEGSMKHNIKEDTFVISELDISRITEYGEESKCISVTYPHLSKYCFCTDMQKKIVVVY